jgi:hypothetical protein
VSPSPEAREGHVPSSSGLDYSARLILMARHHALRHGLDVRREDVTARAEIVEIAKASAWSLATPGTTSRSAAHLHGWPRSFSGTRRSNASTWTTDGWLDTMGRSRPV